MKKNIKAIFIAAILMVGTISVSGVFSSVMAAKPESAVEWSNGFPSGAHFNLNIHGKKMDYACNETSGGGSVFVPEFGDSLIQLIQNKKSSVSELTVHDPCSFGPDDPAKVQLPKGEYQVYTRMLAKPGKPNSDDQPFVIFYPKLVDACNDNGTAPIDGFGDYIDCSSESLVGLGIVTGNGAFDMDSQYLERIAPISGKNEATDITDLFRWSGWVCNESSDTNGDKEITVEDVTVDLNGDGIIDETDLELYLDQNCQITENEWIFNIADLVIYGWDYKNNGAKLVQVRFYPLDTTEFT